MDQFWHGRSYRQMGNDQLFASVDLDNRHRRQRPIINHQLRRPIDSTNLDDHFLFLNRNEAAQVLKFRDNIRAYQIDNEKYNLCTPIRDTLLDKRTGLEFLANRRKKRKRNAEKDAAQWECFIGPGLAPATNADAMDISPSTPARARTPEPSAISPTTSAADAALDRQLMDFVDDILEEEDVNDLAQADGANHQPPATNDSAASSPASPEHSGRQLRTRNRQPDYREPAPVPSSFYKQSPQKKSARTKDPPRCCPHEVPSDFLAVLDKPSTFALDAAEKYSAFLKNLCHKHLQTFAMVAVAQKRDYYPLQLLSMLLLLAAAASTLSPTLDPLSRPSRPRASSLPDINHLPAFARPREAYPCTTSDAASLLEAGFPDGPIFAHPHQQFQWGPRDRPIVQLFRRIENLNTAVSVQIPSRSAVAKASDTRKLTTVQARFLDQNDTDDPWNIAFRSPLPPSIHPAELLSWRELPAPSPHPRRPAHWAHPSVSHPVQ
ncbi:hypothetical protein MKZ38_000198 [Zalerion maritima]|uniref:Uncharacterized protein n=1 Tax=Zalerion maritima TaxID=339359 RepID=A0AAD5RTD7_9PEZI|nr:hypothetical protein MKZ38_000198 [Zalerion maritima]